MSYEGLLRRALRVKAGSQSGQERISSSGNIAEVPLAEEKKKR